MSEREIRRLLERACDELDRYARQAGKAMLPGAVGVTLALSGCAGTAKNDPTVDPIKGDPIEAVATADAGVAAVDTPPPPPDRTVAVDAAVPDQVIERPPYYDIPKPYMAPDAVPLYQTLDKTRLG